MTTIVNGLKYQQGLRAAGVEAEQATKMAEALADAVSADALATKADLQTGLADLKSGLIMWLVGVQIAVGALIVAALKL